MFLIALLILGQVDLPLDPPTQFAAVDDIVVVGVRATAAASQQIAAIDAILGWDPSQLELLGVAAHPSWFVSGFFPDPDGINLDTTDGQALFTVLAPPGSPVIVPPDLVVATITFRVHATGDVSLIDSLGTFGRTRVVSATPGVEITGDISLAACVGIPGTWVDLGHGLAGTGGVQPLLSGTGALACEDMTTFTLVDGLPGAPAFFVLGISEITLPFKGGVIVPAPDIVVALVVPPGGSIVFGFPWPTGIPSGAALAYQYWFKDVGGPFGFSASNALRSTTG